MECRAKGSSPEENTIVCRCEDITIADLRDYISQGFTSIDELRRVARIGMGPCQGRTCRHIVISELSRALNQKVEDIKMPVFRPPTRPVPLGTIAGCDADGQNQS